MNMRLIALTSAVTLAGLVIPAIAQCRSGDMSKTSPPDKAADTVAPRGAALAPDAEDIRETLVTVTEAAVKKDGFDNLVMRFVDFDRDRIGKNELTQADWDKLNGRIAQIQKTWQAKYDKEFDIEQQELVFNDKFLIVQGVIGEAQPAGSRLGDDKIDKSLPDTTPGPNADKIAGGDTNREPGRKVAKVTFPASHDLPGLYIPMIHEFPDSWKIDVPDQVDGRTLYDNLLRELTILGDHPDQWPEDVNDAYRLVSHRVLIAVMDVDESKAGDMGGKAPEMPEKPR